LRRAPLMMWALLTPRWRREMMVVNFGIMPAAM
jgi:hypothetical protein